MIIKKTSVLEWKEAYLRSLLIICRFLMYERNYQQNCTIIRKKLSAQVEGRIPEETKLDHHLLGS
jgi:hypothetical protein